MFLISISADLLHVFSNVSKDLNFIEHTSDIGWKEFQRAKPIIIDPGLYMNRKSEVFWATQRRAVPTAFRLFTGIWKLLHIFDSAPLCCLCS
jgi:hypothetical protein